jgi:hypothetical protein
MGREKALGWELRLTAGAYLSAKKAAMEFASKRARRSLGVVSEMELGPRRTVVVM